MKTKEHKMYMDQYGDVVWARTVGELRQKCGGGKVEVMYADKKDGTTVRCGYIIGGARGRWFSAYQPIEMPA